MLYLLALILATCRGSDLVPQLIDRATLTERLNKWKQECHTQIAGFKNDALATMNNTHDSIQKEAWAASAGVGGVAAGSTFIPFVGAFYGIPASFTSAVGTMMLWSKRCKSVYSSAAAKILDADKAKSEISDMVKRFNETMISKKTKSATFLAAIPKSPKRRKLGATLGTPEVAVPEGTMTLEEWTAVVAKMKDIPSGSGLLAKLGDTTTSYAEYLETVGSNSARDVTTMKNFEALKMMTEKLGGKTTQEAADAAAQAAARMRPQALTGPQVAPEVDQALVDAAEASAKTVAEDLVEVGTEEAVKASLLSSPEVIAAEGTDVVIGWIPWVGPVAAGSAMTLAMLWDTDRTSKQIRDSHITSINTLYAAMDAAVDKQADYLYDGYLHHA